jgi:hypothetical protein
VSQNELRDVERRTYLSYFDDGLLTIVAGLPVLMFGLGMVFDSSLFFIFTWLPIILYLPIKRAITLPRLGLVRFSPQRRQKISRSLVMLLIAGILSFMIGILAFAGFEGQVIDIRSFMMEYGLLAFGGIMASAFVLIAIFFEVRRFFAYGLVVFGGWLVPHVAPIEEGITVTIAGALVTMIGLAILARFLATTPVQSE